MSRPLDIVIVGLTVTSSWGNGHATTYRSLIRGLTSRGHRVIFLEQNAPWYAANCDEPHLADATNEIYSDFDELVARFTGLVEEADLAIVGSYVPDGARVGEWVTTVARGRTAFYDIDTPVTLAKLEAGDHEYITPALIPRYDLYLSFTGGPTLQLIESRYGSPMARALYCSVDPEKYRPMTCAPRWDLGYLGTYSVDRQPALEALLLEPARRWEHGRFTVAGPQYPESVDWPANVTREIHLSPREHAAFYGAQRYTLNVTREAMKQAGYSPSVRLFEAGACGVPVISDWWPGLDALFQIGTEVLIAQSADDSLRILKDWPESRRLELAAAARSRVLSEHTSERRAVGLECCLKELNDQVSAGAPRRHRRGREVSGRVEGWAPSQRERDGAGAEPGGEVVAIPGSGGLHKPSGASR